MTALLLVLAGHNLNPWSRGLDAFLSLQVTVQNFTLLIGFATMLVLVFRATGLYEAALVRRWRDELLRVLVSTTVLAAMVLLFVSTIPSAALDRSDVIDFWAGISAAAVATRAVRAGLARSVGTRRRVLIVGTGPRALRICRELSADPLTSYEVLGFVDTDTRRRSAFIARRTLASLDRLEPILAREHVDEVHVGLPVRSHYLQIQEAISACERVGVKVVYRADIFDMELARPWVLAPWPRVELQVVTEEGLAVALKRAIDIVGAIAGLILLGPLMLATAASIRVTSGSPVIYAQERYGLNRRRFRMLKFRTMVQNAEQLQATLESRNEVQGPVFKIARDPRVTFLGRWLRRTSIDELPQLLNILRGDMSLVGPRPLPLRDVARFTRPADMRRFSVRPGLTGLWQVSGRSGLGFDQWIKLDLHYIDHWSLALDAAILARTVPAVLRGTGAS